MPATVAVSLRAMRFHALVGILPHERELPQPLEVDVTAWVDGGLEDPLDYRILWDVAARASAAGHGYLEQVAAAVVDGALALPRVARVAVAVRKPHVALPGPLAGAEVRVERARDA